MLYASATALCTGLCLVHEKAAQVLAQAESFTCGDSTQLEALETLIEKHHSLLFVLRNSCVLSDRKSSSGRLARLYVNFLLASWEELEAELAKSQDSRPFWLAILSIEKMMLHFIEYHAQKEDMPIEGAVLLEEQINALRLAVQRYQQAYLRSKARHSKLQLQPG